MKRDINLQALSRDHHHGLLLGWKIRQGLKYAVSTDLIMEYVRYFSQKALFPHFREEEQYVLRFLDYEDTFKQRTLLEHREIRAAIRALGTPDGRKDELLLRLAVMLDDHIRFEERELFPYMQEELSAGQLEEIGMAINVAHQPFVEDFHTEFWVSHVD